MTNTSLLECRIQKSGLKKSYIAQVLGITLKTLGNKIANRCEFKASEIDKLCKLLGITDPAEKEAIFFAAKVA
jgi:hypothetical protein